MGSHYQNGNNSLKLWSFEKLEQKCLKSLQLYRQMFWILKIQFGKQILSKLRSWYAVGKINFKGYNKMGSNVPFGCVRIAPLETICYHLNITFNFNISFCPSPTDKLYSLHFALCS